MTDSYHSSDDRAYWEAEEERVSHLTAKDFGPIHIFTEAERAARHAAWERNQHKAAGAARKSAGR